MDLTIKAAFAYHGPPGKAGIGLVCAPPFYAIWHVDAGEARVVRGKRTWTCGPGGVLVIPPCWRRMQRFSRGTILVSVGLIFHRHNAEFPVELTEPVALHGPAARRLRTAACSVAASANDAADHPGDMIRSITHRAEVHRFAATWLQLMLDHGSQIRVPVSEDARLERARAALTASPRIGPIPYAELKQACGLGRSQLDRLFRLAYGLTPHQVRDRAILDRIQSQFGDPQRSVAGIARQFGASSASHFIRWYRRQTGDTPGRHLRERSTATP